jgi:nicotinamidase-related amidase
MPVDLDALLAPTRSALLIHECQRGVVGDLSGLPALAEQAQAGMLGAIDELARAARAAGIPVVHCTAERRPDARGGNQNARLFQSMLRTEHPMLPGSQAAQIVPEISVATDDFILPRIHGLSSFHDSGLDSILRNLGVQTTVGVGVSVNVAIQNFAFDAVNRAYQVVIPRDAVAGFPASYVDAVFEHSLAAVTTLVESRTILEIWHRASEAKKRG